MNRPRRFPSLEQVLVVTGVFLFGAGLGWAVWLFPLLETMEEIVTSREGTEIAYAAERQEAMDEPVVMWEEPALQTRGLGWLYDVFTSPDVFRDVDQNQWTLSVPAPVSTSAEDNVEREPPFGVEVLGIEQELFRLQLVGYGGSPGHYFGMFENAATKETFLGRAGRLIPELNLRIEDLEVRSARLAQVDTEPLVQSLAYATVVDLETSVRTRLSSSERLICGSPSVRLRTQLGGELWLNEGAACVADSFEFRITRINLNDSVVAIVRSGANEADLLTKTFDTKIALSPQRDRRAPTMETRFMQDEGSRSTESSTTHVFAELFP